ncbi:MAG: hypothetical protein JW754_00680 [Candidatus Aenigmarchaeota archaeon]|nr:hypothetical protein [Candidatus Aenigmarchaeota archaeon]
MRLPVRKGFSFGLTSGIITTLGLIVGLHAGTNSRIAVLGGILVIAIADALSDALGIHISEESENKHTVKEIWESTAYTFFSKLVFSMTFMVPVLFLELYTAIIVSIIWGLSLIAVFSFYIACKQKASPWKMMAEHLVIAALVIIITHYVGDWAAMVFG